MQKFYFLLFLYFLHIQGHTTAQAQKIDRIIEPLQEKKYPKAKGNLEKMQKDYPTDPIYFLGAGLFYADALNPDYEPFTAFKNLKEAKNKWQNLELKKIQKLAENDKIDTVFISNNINILLDNELQKAIQNAKTEDLRKYTEQFAGTPQAIKAEENMYLVAFAEAEKTNTVFGYEIFRQKYPKAPQITQAIDKIHDLSFAQAQATHTPESYQIFVQKYPNAPQIDKAIAIGAKLTYEIATKSNTREDLSTFIASHPNSPHLQEAKNRLENSYFKEKKILVQQNNTGSFTNFEVLIDLYVDNIEGKTAKYFIDVVSIPPNKYEQQGDNLGENTKHYNYFFNKISPKIAYITEENVISDIWVGNSTYHTSKSAIRYVFFKERQGTFSCVQQTYSKNDGSDVSVSDEIIVFQNKTAEELIKDAPKSIDKCFRKMQHRGWYEYEGYLLKYYKDIASKEGKKLTLKLNNGKTKNFISGRESTDEYSFKSNADNSVYIFSGYNKYFDCFIVHSHLHMGGGSISLVSKANGNVLMALHIEPGSSTFSFSPEADKVLSVSASGYGVDLVIYRGEKEMVVRENVDITPKSNGFIMLSLLDWVDNNTFKLGFGNGGGNDKIYTYHFRNGSWHLE